ncbi:MAG: hypothetical protein ACTSQV_06755, partial [Alphaproteobacteria bacterium]
MLIFGFLDASALTVGRAFVAEAQGMAIVHDLHLTSPSTMGLGRRRYISVNCHISPPDLSSSINNLRLTPGSGYQMI